MMTLAKQSGLQWLLRRKLFLEWIRGPGPLSLCRLVWGKPRGVIILLHPPFAPILHIQAEFGAFLP